MRENRMHGSTGKGWKRSLRPPRQPLTLRSLIEVTKGDSLEQALLQLQRRQGEGDLQSLRRLGIHQRATDGVEELQPLRRHGPCGW